MPSVIAKCKAEYEAEKVSMGVNTETQTMLDNVLKAIASNNIDASMFAPREEPSARNAERFENSMKECRATYNPISA